MSGESLDGVLNHYRNPRNYGAISCPDATAEDVNELCGDRVRFEVAFEGQTIGRIGWVGDGCALMIASASLLSERATGSGLDSVTAISVDDLIGYLGTRVNSARRQCVELPLVTLQRAADGGRRGGSSD